MTPFKPICESCKGDIHLGKNNYKEIDGEGRVLYVHCTCYPAWAGVGVRCDDQEEALARIEEGG